MNPKLRPFYSVVEPVSLLTTTSADSFVGPKNGTVVAIPQQQQYIPDEANTDANNNITPSSSLPLYQLALIGSLATLMGDAAMHPIDSIKTIQQSHVGHDLSIPQAFSYLYHHHTLYQGFSTYALADALAGAVKLGVYEYGRPSPWAAAAAFVVSSIPLVPGEFIKQQLQMGYYNDWWQVVGAATPLTSLYTGYDTVLLRDVPFTVLELGIYEYCCSRGGGGSKLIAAGIAGAVAATLTTPLDTIKTQVMVGDLAVWTDGLAQPPELLWAGVVARVAWIVPFTMIYLPLYDSMKAWLSERRANQIKLNNEDT